jgi:hypothetical protein
MTLHLHPSSYMGKNSPNISISVYIWNVAKYEILLQFFVFFLQNEAKCRENCLRGVLSISRNFLLNYYYHKAIETGFNFL